MDSVEEQRTQKHYLVLSGGRGAHTVLYLLRAPALLEAVQAYIRHMDPEISFEADGSVVLKGVRKTVRYPHPLAYVEALYKANGEWQIREVREDAWDTEFEEVFCGEDASDIESLIAECRSLLRETHPRSRAPAFVWYLQDGAVVTFFLKRRPFGIDVLGRYLVRWAAYHDVSLGPPVTAWSGSYDEILQRLYLRWWDGWNTHPFTDQPLDPHTGRFLKG